MNEMYFVLSVSDIKRLLRVARANKIANRKNSDDHCIVLEGLHAAEGYPEQLSSVSFWTAVHKVQASTERYNEVAK